MAKKKVILAAVVLLVIVLVGAIVYLKNNSGEEGGFRQLTLNERPFATLTPSEDGHWLTLRIENLVVKEAKRLEYLLLYNLEDGRSQGVPGSVDLTGKKTFEQNILLGSESSGKYRYDEGVTDGSLTITYRSEKDVIISRFTSRFILQLGGDDLVIEEGDFLYRFEEEYPEDWFVLMSTMGVPMRFDKEVAVGPFGILSSSDKSFRGSVETTGDVYRYNGREWELLDDSGLFAGLGVFLTVEN
jgi:hypothetical protein